MEQEKTIQTETETVTEEDISRLVRKFYARALGDETLRGILEGAIHDWKTHHQAVENFWSNTLLQTDRYQGNMFDLHAALPLRLEHFDSWLTLFHQTAHEVLPAAAAAKVINRAEHVAKRFKAGMFHNGVPLPKLSQL
ncbi:MAG: hypothetical protein FD168_383 [Desulfobulbaceae bacterium]|jgi:hemoglobin|nr:MAG: hypothetical protein FD168_383 [Desulfobulbaceae bacterium]